MNPTPRMTEHFGGPPINSFVSDDQERFRAGDEQYARDMMTLSREKAEREMAFVRALNEPSGRRQGPPPIREPKLPSDFVAKAAALDADILRRGVALSRERLLSLGRKRFDDLIALDGIARQSQRIVGTKTDLTSWQSIQFAFGIAGALVTALTPRTTAEIHAGAGKDREAAGKIEGFADLWKAQPDPQAVRGVYAFRDAFESLVFGQSLLERLSSDGRLRSRLFAGGHGAKVSLFQDWLSVLEGHHFRVMIVQPLWHIVAWLSKEQTRRVEPADLARHWFGVRAPSRAQVALCAAAFDGFLLGYREWDLWNYVGRCTRQVPQPTQLKAWQNELIRSYRLIADFHATITEAFYYPVGDAHGAAFKFDAITHRAFVGRRLRFFNNCLTALIALALDEMHSGAVARFADFVLCEGKPKPATTERIAEKLHAAFGARFNINIEAIK